MKEQTEAADWIYGFWDYLHYDEDNGMFWIANENGIVTLTFPDGSVVDFTTPKEKTK